jgi:hypothetical protein
VLFRGPRPSAIDRGIPTSLHPRHASRVSAANGTTASPLAGTYVLSALGTQTAAPFEYLDLKCGDGRHIQGFFYGDTLVASVSSQPRAP